MKTKEEILVLAAKIRDFIGVQIHTTQEYKDIIKEATGVEFDEKNEMYNFYISPASTKFHGDFQGGLAHHSLAVYYSALRLASAFDLTVQDIDANACIFHDLVKANLYLPLKMSLGYTYNKDMITLPHGTESIRRMHLNNIPISSEAWRFAVAYHMGAFEHDNIDMYSRACEKYKEVLLLHTADMMATKIYKY